MMRKELSHVELECRNELAERLLIKLGESGFSLTELSQNCALDPGLISRILNNKQLPSTDTLDKIASALKLSYEEHLFLEFLAGRVHPSISKDCRILLAKMLYPQPRLTKNV